MLRLRPKQGDPGAACGNGPQPYEAGLHVAAQVRIGKQRNRLRPLPEEASHREVHRSAPLCPCTNAATYSNPNPTSTRHLDGPLEVPHAPEGFFP